MIERGKTGVVGAEDSFFKCDQRFGGDLYLHHRSSGLNDVLSMGGDSD
jgi:hypothetical protein